MTEKRSKALGVKYVSTRGYFLTDTGVLFTHDEVNGKSAESIIKTYKQRLEDSVVGKYNLYDYAYAKSTGHIRKHKNLNGNYQVRERAKKEEPVVVKTKVKPNFQVTVIRIVMAIVGVAAVILSAHYTYRFLLPSNGPFIAMTLSCAMIVFSVVSFDVIIYFWKPRHHGLSIMFSVLWVIVASFSMFSTMEVNYNGYIALEETSLDDNREVNTNRIRLSALELQIEAKKEEIESLTKSVSDYTGSGVTISAWYLTEMQKKVSTASLELQALFDRMDDMLEETPEAVTSTETKKVTFYDSVERITKIPARTLHFVIHILPAVFIDIIAPFSIAIAIFLGGKKDECDA